MEREPIFLNAIRSFMKAFFGLLGLVIAFVLVIFVIVLLASFGSNEVKISGKIVDLPNADGTRTPLRHDTPLILQINLDGVIGSAQHIQQTPRGIQTQLLHSQEGELAGGRIKGVFLRVNTPGGDAFDADSIYRAFLQYKERYQVPIYVYVEGLCASGGMYVASAADKIYATDVSLIGSVGVISNYFNFSETMTKIGVNAETIFKGTGKDALNPLRPWTPGDDTQAKEIVDYLYNHFVDIVVAGRPAITRDDLVNVYGAKVFPAPVAMQHGYIDGVVANRDEALSKLVDAVGLTDESYQVIRFDVLQSLSEILSGGAGPTGEVIHRIEFPQAFDSALLSGYLYLYEPGRE
jgi:protease IV